MSDALFENQTLALKAFSFRWNKDNDHARRMLTRQVRDIPTKYLSQREADQLLEAASRNGLQPRIHGHAAYVWLKLQLSEVPLMRQARSEAGLLAQEAGVHINQTLAMVRAIYHESVEENLAPKVQANQPEPSAKTAAAAAA